MGYLQAIKALIIAIGLFFVRKSGKDAVRAKQAKNNDKARAERQELDTDIHNDSDSDNDEWLRNNR